MSGYEGQPEGVRVGFLLDLFEPWMGVLGSNEWTRLVEASWQLASAAVSCSDDERALVALGWVREELDRAFEEDWWVPDHNGRRERAIRDAQDGYEEIVTSWRQSAKSFNGRVAGRETVASDALEEEIARLPAWVRPDPDAPPLPDPERVEYERLRTKFGG